MYIPIAKGGVAMNKIKFNLILALNTFLWIVLSTINYVGIMLQLEEDIMKIFLWSIITVTMYGVVIYSISMIITRLYLMHRFKKIKTKYVNYKAFRKQIILLSVVILYLYGACYNNSIFIGLLPMLLFFSKKLTNIGRFYIYDNNRLLIIKDISNEYQIKEVIQKGNKISLQEVHTRNLDIKETVYIMDPEESKFLSDIFKNPNEMEVA